MLTKKQKETLEYIERFIKSKGYSPSLEDIRKHFKLSSRSTVHEHINELKEKGYINKLDYQTRGIEISGKTQESSLVRIPMIGLIAAGEPIEAIENKEYIGVPKNRLPRSGEFYALRVTGNSMVNENINDGDVILIKQQDMAENGQNVVALIDNYEVTLKKFYKEKGQIRLQPANKRMKPIIINKDQDLTIQGIVFGIIKNKKELSSKKIIFKKKIKEYTKLPLNKIIQCDALKELKKLPKNSCDIIIVDPPYNIGKDFGNNSDKRELFEYIEWCKNWIDACIRVMKPNGTMFIYGFSETLAYLSVEIPIHKRWLIWHYTNKNVASLNFWQRSHESIICCWKDKPTFNRDAVREPYTEGFLNGAAGKIRVGTPGRFSTNGKETIYKAHESGALPRDVIKIPALAGGAGVNERWFICKTCNKVLEPKKLKLHKDHETMKHPTQKPLELSKKLIQSAMPKKDAVILVPFVGTGSECVAAKELGLSYIGFELNPDYIKIAKKWLLETKSLPRLF
ncbi:MAG: transcriptional repressor LexA [Patescibacteria group bacterium]|nr:transcriptional repressor LexA [Patescibacteria group bacterium]